MHISKHSVCVNCVVRFMRNKNLEHVQLLAFICFYGVHIANSAEIAQTPSVDDQVDAACTAVPSEIKQENDDSS